MERDTRPPRTYLLFFLGIFLLAEICLVVLDLYYLYGQSGTVGDFLFDFLIVSAIIMTLVLFTYFALRGILVRYINSERRFHELADLLPEGIIESDLHGWVTYANDIALAWFGYSQAEIERGALNILDFIDEADRERALENMNITLSGGELKPATYRIKKKDGSVFPVQMSTSRITRGDRPAGVRAVVTDISEQKRIEDLVRDSEKKYRELADSLPEIVFEMDTDGNFTYVNANARRIFGYEEGARPETINVKDVMADSTTAVDEMRLMVRTRTMQVSRENLARRRDGSTFPVMISGQLIMEGDRPVGIRGIVADISDIKSAEKKIGESEEKYRSLFESSIDGILVVGLSTGKITEANQAFLDMIGYPIEELKGRSYAELTPARWHAMETEIIGNQVFVRDYSDEYEKEIIRKDGTIVPVSVRRWMIKDDSGTPIGMWSILRDITEKKVRDAEIERINAELIGYAHTVSHDLKGPIHEVTMAGQTVEMLLDRQQTEEVKGYLADSFDVMRHGLDRANHLIEDMLLLAESGQVPKEVVPVSVSETVAEVLAERFDDIRMRGIDVRLDEDLGVVVASPTHVYQIFSNLLKNAILYGDTLEPVIEIRSLRSDGGAHRYFVRDNGTGIPDAVIDRIFVPFTKGESGDTGIGLSIVQKLVDVYGGNVRAYNDAGACFELTLKDYDK